MERQCEHIHLEHDGKLLLVDMSGDGPACLLYTSDAADE